LNALFVVFALFLFIDDFLHANMPNTETHQRTVTGDSQKRGFAFNS